MNRVSIFFRKKEIFLFPTASGPTLGLSEHPTCSQLDLKQLKSQADNQNPSTTECLSLLGAVGT
jgi:hypothetical protein